MKLCVRSMALASAVLWGGMFLGVALLNQFAGDYGAHLLDFGASLYPGYHGPSGYGSVLVVTMYAVIDGAIAGALLAWLYNTFRKDTTAE